MSKQTIALAYTRPADTLDESEYQALAEALSESARGRGFLAEHARRSRSAETNILLTAIERIEAQVRPRVPAPDPLHDDLRRMLDELRTARARIETGGAAPKVEQLAALLDLVQRRLAALLMSSPAAGHQVATRTAPASRAPEPPPRPSAARWLEEPLAPPPAVNDAGPSPRPVAVHAASSAPTAPAELESEIQAMVAAEMQSRTKSPPVAAEAAAPVADTTVESAADALAAIMALSEEERIALFT